MRKTFELKTPKELERDQVHSKIVADYEAMRKRYATASSWRIFTELGRRYSLTAMGVMRICMRKNVYQPKKSRS